MSLEELLYERDQREFYQFKYKTRFPYSLLLGITRNDKIDYEIDGLLL